MIYNIQLPKFREAEKDFNDPLYSWIYTIETAQREKKTIEEVIKMTPELQTFTQKDAGFRQFCDQYQRVASDPKTRNEYFYWWLDQSSEESIRAEREEKGAARGRTEILDLLRHGASPADILARYGQ